MNRGGVGRRGEERRRKVSEKGERETEEREVRWELWVLFVG